MKNKNEVIAFIKSELECNNTLVFASLGNGGAGLTYMQSQDEDVITCFIAELEEADFEGLVSGAEDITECEYYSDGCEVYQFGGENGYYTQVMTFE